jgi:ribonuclease P protein subunit POP4
MTKEELIGKKIKIIESPNKSLKGIEGIVVDETKNMLVIECDDTVKKVVKDQCVFDIAGKRVVGKDITKRPEERIKQ